MLVRCEADPKPFRLAKGAVLRQSKRAAAHAGTDAELSRESAEDAVVVASLVPEMVAADLLWSPSHESRQYCCLNAAC